MALFFFWGGGEFFSPALGSFLSGVGFRREPSGLPSRDVLNRLLQYSPPRTRHMSVLKSGAGASRPSARKESTRPEPQL